jgi:hypothetical protein
MTGGDVGIILGAISVVASAIHNFIPNKPKSKWGKILDTIIAICALNGNIKGVMNKGESKFK